MTTEYGQTQTATKNVIFVKNKIFLTARLIFCFVKKLYKYMYDILYFFFDWPATFTLFKYHFATVHNE